VPEGRKRPEVQRLAESFARAGYLVVVPDLPGLMEDRITPKTVQETTHVAHKISTRADAEGEEVALVGVSTGATLALVAAEKPELRGRVSRRWRGAICGHKDRPEPRHYQPLPPG
jgi:dienelactone hydrolase